MENSGFEVILSEKADKDFESFLHNCIKSFNNRSSELFRQVRSGPKSPLPINIYVQNDNGEMIGGLAASTYWGWLNIEDFYIPDHLRGKGLGSRILDMAESTAQDRICSKAQLTTYDFQAREFYERRGWKVVGELKDYPPGSSYFWMCKNL